MLSQHPYCRINTTAAWKKLCFISMKVDLYIIVAMCYTL